MMTIHMTPTELAREAGLQRREVITECMRLGVPIFEGRIDKDLFFKVREDDRQDKIDKAEEAAEHGTS